MTQKEWEKIPWGNVKIGVDYTEIELENGETIKVRPKKLVLLNERGEEMEDVLENFLNSLPTPLI